MAKIDIQRVLISLPDSKIEARVVLSCPRQNMPNPVLIDNHCNNCLYFVNLALDNSLKGYYCLCHNKD